MRNACKILGVPFEIVKSPKNIRTKLLKESLWISKKVGYLTDYCGNCEAILRMISMNTARKYGAPFVLWGASALETLHNEFYSEYRSTGKQKKSHLSFLIVKLRTKIKVVLKDLRKLSRIPRKIYPYVGYHSIKYSIYSMLQRREFHFPLRYILRPHSVPFFSEKNPIFIHFFDFIPWDSINCIKILEDELNWKHPVDKVSRFDCSIHCLANYHYLKEYGISHDGVNLCNFVRENRMSRGEAQARERDVVDSTDKECQELLNVIGLKKFGNQKVKKWGKQKSLFS